MEHNPQNYPQPASFDEPMEVESSREFTQAGFKVLEVFCPRCGKKSHTYEGRHQCTCNNWIRVKRPAA